MRVQNSGQEPTPQGAPKSPRCADLCSDRAEAAGTARRELPLAPQIAGGTDQWRRLLQYASSLRELLAASEAVCRGSVC